MKTLFLLLLFALPALATEELIIGRLGAPWTLVRETTSKVQIARDSLWLWDAEPGQNLATLALQRGGRIYAIQTDKDAFGQTIYSFPSSAGLEGILDGDELSAFDPDERDFPRQVELYLDLGGHFGVSQIRFFPRLDSEHRGRYVQAFELGSDRTDLDDPTNLRATVDLPFSLLINAHTFQPNDQSVVLWPRTGEITEEREMRRVRIKTLSDRPWEIAELEVLANGQVPLGEYISRPLTVPGGSPVWGRLRVDGKDPSTLPIVVQTRTGPDPEPIHYFLRLTKSKTLRKVTKQGWENIVTLTDVERGEAVQGPILPNPLWSAWETVTDGLVVSPAPQEYIQFRVQLSAPGIRLGQFAFEYTSWPLAQVLEAEINPTEVAPGQEISFVLSLLVRRLADDTIPTSGFRRLDILTPAEIAGVDSVRINDREALFKLRRDPGRSFSVDLWERVDPGASLVEVFFRARVFLDGTPFRVQALDERATADSLENVYQFARAGNVEPRTPGGVLSVRLDEEQKELVDALLAPRAFTPNGDGINDFFEVDYTLLKLTRPAPVFFEIYDLSGRRLRQGESLDLSGRFARLWDGRDAYGRRVGPGLYLYRIRVEADAGEERRQGVLGVSY